MMYRIKFSFCLLMIVGMVSCGSNQSKNQEQSAVPNYLSDSKATDQAVLLYNNLLHLSKDKILVGHQDALAYGMGWKGEAFRTDIHDVCNDHPAVFGWDLGHIGDSVNIDNVPFDKMKTWAVEAYKKGGVNTFGWHSRQFVTDGGSWDITPCVSAILPGGEKHDQFLVKLNLVADFFADLKNDKGEVIPVLFRPWHEMNGGWFWWGSKACTPDEYKALWQFTVDYLRNTRGLHNIIYVYSTDMFALADEYLRYYPGDEYVDVLGFDDYHGLNATENTHKTVNMLETVAALANAKNKLYTLSETGIETIPNSIWFTDVVLPTLKLNKETLGISYVLFWRNGRPDHFYAPYKGHASVPDFLKFKADTCTLFLSDITGIYTKTY